MFLDEKYDEGIFTIDDILDAVNHSVTTYYEFPFSSLTRYAYPLDEDGEIQKVTMIIEKWRDLSGRCLL